MSKKMAFAVALIYLLTSRAVDAYSLQNCGERQGLDYLAADHGGDSPFSLSLIICRPAANSHFPFHIIGPSPDGRLIASFRDELGAAIITSVDASDEMMPKKGMTFKRVSYPFEAAPLAVQWSKDGAFIWTAEQERSRGGFAESALAPIKFFTDGRTEALPPLPSEAGSLDGLLWVGRNGLALAAFDIMGDRYRPEHANKDPKIAFIDARQGKILAAQPIKPLISAGTPASKRLSAIWITGAAAIQLPDGRLKAFFLLNPIDEGIVWTQGEQPKLVKNPYFNNRDIGRNFLLTPDGARLLVARRFTTNNVICRDPGGCTRGTPVAEDSAALIDLNTGMTVWSLPRIITDQTPWIPAAISADGHYAAISIPAPSSVDPVWHIKAEIALVDMASGNIIQNVSLYGKAMGFTESNVFWVASESETYFYNPAQ